MAKIHSLGYVAVQSANTAEWPAFAETVFGLETTVSSDGTVTVRWDDRVHRLRISPGPDDRLLHLGWETSDATEFSGFVDHLRSRGVEVTEEPEALAAQRQVTGLASFTDPFGIRQELFYGQGHSDKTFRGQRATSRFVTGDQGLGHVVIIIPDLAAGMAFYEGTLGLRCSDMVDIGPGRMAFLRSNRRHHSLAIWGVPGLLGLNHLMIESASLDDVGRAYDLAQKGEYPISVSLGRHAGDEQISFYTRTPGGWDLEFGHGSVVIEDEDAWTMRRINSAWGSKTELWGHHFRPLDPQSSVHPYPAEPVTLPTLSAKA